MSINTTRDNKLISAVDDLGSFVSQIGSHGANFAAFNEHISNFGVLGVDYLPILQQITIVKARNGHVNSFPQRLDHQINISKQMYNLFKIEQIEQCKGGILFYKTLINPIIIQPISECIIFQGTEMGNSTTEFFYFNGLILKPHEQRACENYLKSRSDVVKISNKYLQLEIAGKYWDKLHLKQFLQCIDQWDIKRTLSAREVSNFPVVCLENIKFPFLMNLSLQNCGIESIQSIDRIWMPSLQVLDLSQNLIRSVLPLRRMNCPRLKRIYIHTNKFEEADGLAELPSSIEEIGISKQVSINWSFKAYIQFSDFSRKEEDLLRYYNLRGNRSIIIFELMINI